MKKIIVGVFSLALLFSCSMKQQVDLIVSNGVIYTVDDQFSIHQAMAIKGGKVVEVGSDEQIKDKYRAKKEHNLDGAALYPGFHDSHSHLYLLGEGLTRVNLRGAKSFDEVIERLKERYDESTPTFLAGDGWDQTQWPGGRFPDNSKLNELFPDIPVVLFRIDFHAAIVNDKAIELLGVKPGDSSIPEREARVVDGKFTGLFFEDSAGRFEEVLPTPNKSELKDQVLTAQEECFKYGLTSVANGGTGKSEMEALEELNDSGQLKVRVDAWVASAKEAMEAYDKPFTKGKLRVATLKLFADGALGSRGALMLEPYSDRAETIGIPVITKESFREHCKWALERGFNVSTHAIGDSANRLVLEGYAEFLEPGNDLRWRVEHSQIVSSKDIELFGKYGIVPSVQPTHATSDMFWAGERIGERIKDAYRYKTLMEQLGWLPSGTDFPIENVNPVETFFAAVARKNLDFLPPEGFQMEEALSREEALRSMTIWSAKATFEEGLKGSLESGKVADFVVLDRDIMEVDEREIPGAKVKATVIDGQLVYGSL